MHGGSHPGLVPACRVSICTSACFVFIGLGKGYPAFLQDTPCTSGGPLNQVCRCAIQTQPKMHCNLSLKAYIFCLKESTLTTIIFFKKTYWMSRFISSKAFCWKASRCFPKPCRLALSICVCETFSSALGYWRPLASIGLCPWISTTSYIMGSLWFHIAVKMWPNWSLVCSDVNVSKRTLQMGIIHRALAAFSLKLWWSLLGVYIKRQGITKIWLILFLVKLCHAVNGFWLAHSWVL